MFILILHLLNRAVNILVTVAGADIQQYAAVTYRQNPGNEALHGFPTRTVRESVIRIQKPDRSISTEMPVVTNKFQISGVP